MYKRILVVVDDHSITSASRSLLEASAIADAAGVRSQRAMGAGKDRAEYVVEAESKNALLRLIGGSIVPGLITKARVPVLVCKEYAPKSKRRVRSYPRNHEQPEAMPVMH